MITFENYQDLVIDWAETRKIIPNSTSTAQLLKAVSEMGELADAVNAGNREDMIDAVGDVVVCLINLCALEDTDVTTCLAHAWQQIKDRKGLIIRPNRRPKPRPLSNDSTAQPPPTSELKATRLPPSTPSQTP